MINIHPALYYEVKCDRCDRKTGFYTQEECLEWVHRQLEEQGWEIDGNKHICNGCGCDPACTCRPVEGLGGLYYYGGIDGCPVHGFGEVNDQD